MELLEAFQTYPGVERTIIVKSDLLRLGARLSPAALAQARRNPNLRIKEYGIFSYDSAPRSAVARDAYPAGIFLRDGTPDGTPVQLRMAENTPYLIDCRDGRLPIFWNDQEVSEVLEFEEQAGYYNRLFPDGTPYQAYVFSVGRDHLQITANKHCDYFSRDRQCLFCDLTPFAAAQQKGGEKMVLRKQAEKVAEVLYTGFQEKRFRHLLINGGTFLTPYQSKSELAWYTDFLETIRQRLWTWYPTCLQISAQDDEGWKRVRETGISCIEPNIEVWGEKLFSVVCPGKQQAFGFDTWVRRTINAVKYFGRGNVNPSFVAGVEMAQPFGFGDYRAAVKHTLAGHDFLMREGVLPRQGGFWCIESGSKLAGNTPPPLEFYLELGLGYLELRQKHSFDQLFACHCRHCLNHGTEFDFEYFHGRSPASRRAEVESGRLNIKTKDA
jgi:hypothetical protein